MNSTIREFEEGIVMFLNQFDLPVEVKKLVIKDVYMQLDRLANEAINQEMMKKELEAKAIEEEQEIKNEEVTE